MYILSNVNSHNDKYMFMKDLSVGDACFNSQKAPKLLFPRLKTHDRKRSVWFPIDRARPAHSNLDEDQFCCDAENDLPP